MALALSLSLPAFGAEAENFVKGKHSELTALVSKAKSADDEKKLDAAFDAVFDYDGLAQATLKDSWEQRTPAERAEFTSLLKDLVRNRLPSQHQKYPSATRWTTRRRRRRGRQGRAHRCPQQEERARRAGQHRLRGPPGRRQMADLGHRDGRLELGSKLPKSVRKVIEKKGFDELLKRMKAKRDKGGGGRLSFGRAAPDGLRRDFSHFRALFQRDIARRGRLTGTIAGPWVRLGIRPALHRGGLRRSLASPSGRPRSS